jgi:long-chain acyl-CoA synthetase
MTLNTLPALFAARAAAQPDATILRKKDRGIWKAIGWAELAARQRAIGMGLRAVGLRGGDVVAVLADPGVDWIAADLAILGAGMVSLGLYPTDGAERIRDLLRETGCRLLFVEGEEQLDKALQLRDACPTLERVVIFDMKGLRDFADASCESLDSLRARGEAADSAEPGVWERGVDAIVPDDIAVLAVTAGTAGPARLVVLTHRNIVTQLGTAARLTGQLQGDQRLAFLPMGLASERVFGLYLALATGTISNLVESSETVPENLREVRPSVMFAIPRIWEKLHAQVGIAVAGATRLQRFLYHRALAAQGPMARLLDWLVLRPVRQTLGLDRLRLAFVGGAPVSAELIRWYRRMGIELRALYGLTESAGVVTVMPAGASNAKAVGQALPAAEMMLSGQGEILLRGDAISPGEWRAAPRGEAWLATGDVGRIADGWLYLSGRVQDTVQANGAGPLPAEIENTLKLSPYIADALVTGGGQDVLACLVMVEPEAVERWAQEHNIPFTSFASLTTQDAVRQLIGEEIARWQAQAGQATRHPIQQFRLIDRRIEPEDPEVTPLMKLRRHVVTVKYQALLDEMYRAA